jgi:2-polyprenyl-6-methoxyphenol hydroxylase-like FAD-dependent oxidoreductase
MGAEEHAAVIAAGGPTGMMLVAEPAPAGVDAVIVERREPRWGLGSRSGGLHARTIEVLDQRGVGERFEEILAGWVAELDVPTRGGKAGACGSC